MVHELFTARLASPVQPSPLGPITKPLETVSVPKLTEEFPRLVTVIACCALVVPTICTWNCVLSGVTRSVFAFATPLPDKVAVTIVLPSAKVTGNCTLPVRVPVADGVNLTFTWQEPPTDIVWPEQPSLPPCAPRSENSFAGGAPRFVPVTVPRVNDRFPLFVSVSVTL